MIKPTDFKIRASQTYQIMGKRGLGKTGQTYVEKFAKDYIYGFTPQIKSKYFTKGIWMENDAIDAVADYTNMGMLVKNEVHYHNEWMTGTPDVIVPGQKMIIDTKCSWDHHSFPLFQKEVDDMYYYQGQVYMELTGYKKFCVAYVLLNTPVELLQEHELDYNYDSVSMDKRIKLFHFDYDANCVALIKERVEECRTYLKSIL